jgi:hypothetical protein
MSAALPPLPAGYVRDLGRTARTSPVRPAAPPVVRPVVRPPAEPEAPPVPLSGVLREVTSAGGAPVTVHRADYSRPTPHGGWTIHGYAWRCTTCRRISPGYEPRHFGAALTAARTHSCEDPHA